MNSDYDIHGVLLMPDGNGGFVPCPAVLTEEELIRFLRIPHVSKSKEPANVIANLKRKHALPRLHLCGSTLYPTREVLKWISDRCDIQ